MKKLISVGLAALMCLGLLCALAPQSRAEVEKDGQEVTSADGLQVNDIVTFGSYAYGSQDDSAEIEWVVIGVNGSRVTLLSRYVLDSRPYHTEDKKVSWQTAELNKWLNSTFKDEAFSAEEQILINGGITLPSMEEARALSATLLQPAFTPYAISRGGDSARCVWWLRDGVQLRPYNGEEINCASVVQQGKILEACYLVTFRGKGVRPMVQIDFERKGEEGDNPILYPSEETGLLMKGNQTVTSSDELALFDDVMFGAYPQNGTFDEAIHWIVIGKEGDKVRLLCELALDTLQYQDVYGAVPWEECSLHAWLNSTFLDAAFAPVEQEMISDEIGLLSEAEARELPTEYRITHFTPYALILGADEKRCIWWLKDSALLQVQDGNKTTDMYCASVVLDTGAIIKSAYRVDIGHKGVRPVIEVDLGLLPTF